MNDVQLNQSWLEGFCKIAQAEYGLSDEAVVALLRVGSQRELLEKNAKYAEGFQEELEKQGAGTWDALKFLISHLPAAAAGAFAVPLYKTVRDKVMLDPQQRAYAEQAERMAELARSGASGLELDLASAQAAKGGYERTKNQLRSFESMGFSKDRNNDYGYHPSWY